MAYQALGIDPTQVVEATGTPEFELGQVGEDSLGNRYVYARSNGATPAKVGVALDINWDFIDGNGVIISGVSPVAFADNEYGWIQVSGKVANTNVADSLTAGMLLAILADANGDFQQISATSATTGAHSPIALLLENVAAGVADILLYNRL